MNRVSAARDPKRIVEQGYDRIAHDYARLEGEAPWPRLRWLGKVLDRLEPGSSVLDLGCGSGDPAGIEVAKQHHITASTSLRPRSTLPANTSLPAISCTAMPPRSSFRPPPSTP